MSNDPQAKEFDSLHYLGFLPGAYDDFNLLKQTFYTKLVERGLVYMYDKGYDVDPDSPILKTTEEHIEFHDDGKKTENPKKVLIVGAGISGLAAAYELKRAGHEVMILERQERVGGRIKTLHFPFDPKRLLGEAGAMRIPLKNRHYLTDAYVDKFDLRKRPFYNIDPDHNCFVSVKDMTHHMTVRIQDFQSEDEQAKKRAKWMCDHLWPGWDSRIKEIERKLKVDLKIDHIMDYYHSTIKEVLKSAPQKPKDVHNVEKYTEKWRKWMTRWSKLSWLDFLSSDTCCDEDVFSVYRPWPKIAIDGLSDINYMNHTELSVAAILAEEVGKWWTPEMYTLADGMEKLPEAFINPKEQFNLDKDIQYGMTVKKVVWNGGCAGAESSDSSYPIRVFGQQTRTGFESHFDADAVILTLPLNIMRQVEFSPYLPQHVNDAIAGITYEPSTKIFLGFRERFWEKTKFPVKNGGISKTNLPIGQIVYPRERDTNRGVLMFYTWNKEALLFGSQPEDQAITEALRELQLVYQDLFEEGTKPSKVIDYFEAGAIQSWYTDAAAEGAYVRLLPYSYMNHLRTLLEPKQIRPIFFGGEAISFANGWIQGALESGLRAAWQFYKYNENKK